MENYYDERLIEIKRLRFREYWTLRDIGKKFGISFQRVQQLLNFETGGTVTTKRNEKLVNDPKFDGMTGQEIADVTGLHSATVYKHRVFRKSLEDKFWENVEVGGEDECWEWKGLIHPNGYGWLRENNIGNDYVHRISYKLNIGEIPDGNWVRQKCKNKLCINYNHLYLYVPKNQL